MKIENTAETNLEINISNGEKLRISNLRVNGDIYSADGALITKGAGIELNTVQCADLSSAAVQEIANTFFGLTE